MRITTHIGPSGEVTNATADGKGLSPEVVACLIARVKKAQFSPPEGGSTAIVIPVTFTQR